MNNLAGLSLEQAPPISVPLRFFLTAPLFAVAAALLLMWQGPAAFDSRWNPALLGLTHLLTLGFMGMVMLGAIMQMLPVVAGTPVPRPVPVAAVTHVAGTLGVVLLAAGLAFTQPALLKLALPLLGIVFLPFALLVVITLRRAQPGNMTARAMRLAALMLAATVLLGLLLLSNHAWGWWLQAREALADLHLTWGLLGWVGLLIIGVAWQVVPMFQLTPAYPVRLTRWLVPLLFGLLLALVLAGALPWLQRILRLLLAAGFVVFVAATLRLQAQRRRKLPDVSLDLWRIGLASLLLAIALWLLAQWLPAVAEQPAYPLALAVLTIVGFAMSIINGMLYKIAPFLAWFHLQSRNRGAVIVLPNMREILPESRSKGQMRLHLAALCALLAAACWPAVFIYPSALLFGASNLWLWLNIVATVRIYRSASARLEQAHRSVG